MNEDLEGILFKWFTIGRSMQVSERTLQRWCVDAKIELVRWGTRAGDPVCFPNDQLPALLRRLLRSPARRKVEANLRRKLPPVKPPVRVLTRWWL